MLDSLTIRNFRLFEELTIERLGRVNLIVGKNNSGKSCLLEAVELLISGFSPLTALVILARRGEYVPPPLNSRSERNTHLRGSEPHPVSHLFFGHGLDERAIQLAATMAGSALELNVGAAYYSGNGHVKPQRLGPEPVIGAANRRFLEIRRHLSGRDGQPEPLLALDLDFNAAVSHLEPDASPAAIFVPVNGLANLDFGRYWNAIALQPEEHRIVAALTTIFPEILDVTVNYDPDLGDYLVRVRLTDGTISTVNSLGDGVRRMFGILLAVTAARHGFLLIDEIESGLHWSVQQALWQSLFAFAEELDVQVFATTHSEDTISAFESVWSEHENLGCFHRLEHHPRTGKLIISTYALETLSASVETDSEVR